MNEFWTLIFTFNPVCYIPPGKRPHKQPICMKFELIISHLILFAIYHPKIVRWIASHFMNNVWYNLQYCDVPGKIPTVIYFNLQFPSGIIDFQLHIVLTVISYEQERASFVRDIVQTEKVTDLMDLHLPLMSTNWFLFIINPCGDTRKGTQIPGASFFHHWINPLQLFFNPWGIFWIQPQSFTSTLVLKIWGSWVELFFSVIPPFIGVGKVHMPQVKSVFILFHASFS